MTRPPALSIYRPLPGARARLFAFPHAGGGASAFAKLRLALSTYHVELCALQAPGRENRSAEPFHPRVEDVAHEFAAAAETLLPLPSAFLGHSFGGLTAYLTARLLAHKSAAPDHLVVSGSVSPATRFPTNGAAGPGTFREQIVALGGIPDAILADPELFDMFEAVIAADIALSASYRHSPNPVLPCPITVYSGTRDHAAPPSLASGWQLFTAHRLRMRNFEGGHFFLYAEPDVTAAALIADLGWDAFTG